MSVLLRENRINSNELAVDETIFSQANGILGIRGSFVEGYGNDQDDAYALINGFYNYYPFKYEENSIHFPQLGQTIVKLPDAVTMLIQFNGEDINLTSSRLISLTRSYHLSEGYVSRIANYETKNKEIISIEEKRIVSKLIKGLVEIEVTIHNLSDRKGILRLISGIQLPKVKKAVNDDPRLAQQKRHLDLIELGIHKGAAFLKARTNKSNMDVEIYITHSHKFEYIQGEDSILGNYETSLEPKSSLTINKKIIYKSLFTHSNVDAYRLLESLTSFNEQKQMQEKLTLEFWKKSLVEVSDPNIDLALKYSIYQLNSSGGEIDDLQIAAKGISGDGYEGHYFWDTEIYMIPFFILTQPVKARNLLMYRYKNLNKARDEAKHLGTFRGAKIPWRTINGLETSPYYPAGSAQIHINSDIAYSVISYFNMTNDREFMTQYGLEILLETAVFILDYGTFEKEKFHLNTVTGPDEYTALVNDNYYTNSMAKFHFDGLLKLAGEFKDDFKHTLSKTGFETSILVDLERASKGIQFFKDETLNVIAQDSSFLSKKELNLKSIPKENHPLLLHYHPLFIYRHQVLKQADTILSFILLNRELDETYRNSYHYYLDRTTHDSSLSKCMYGISAYKLQDDELAYRYFKEALFIDLDDERNHSKHGLHLANIGGTYLMLTYGLFGIRIHEGLSISPVKQRQLHNAKLRIEYKNIEVRLELNEEYLCVEAERPVDIMIYNELIHVDHPIKVLIK